MFVCALLLVCCEKQLPKRHVERIKNIYSEDSIYHPRMGVGFANCTVTYVKDSVFDYLYNVDDVDSGYIYTKQSPQELYYQDARFYWAQDNDDVIYNEIENY